MPSAAVPGMTAKFCSAAKDEKTLAGLAAEAQWRFATVGSSSLTKTLTAQQWADKKAIVQLSHRRFAEFDAGNWQGYVDAYTDEGRFIIVAAGSGDEGTTFIEGKKAIHDIIKLLYQQRQEDPNIEDFFHEILKIDFMELTADYAEIIMHLNTWTKDTGKDWEQKDLGGRASGQYKLITKHRKVGSAWFCMQQTALVAPMM